MSFRQDEDLFEESRMSFGQHLEELRWVLVKSLIALAIGCCFGFYFAEDVVKQLNVPLEKALNKYDLIDAQERMVEDLGYIPPDLNLWMEDSGYLPEERLFDFDDFIRKMRSRVPGFAKELNLEPYRFSKSDFDLKTLPELAKRLANQTDDANSNEERLKAVWKRAKEFHNQISLISNKAEADDSDLQVFVEAFDQVASSDLNSDEAFAEQLAAPTKSMFDFMSPPKIKPLAKMKAWLNEHDDKAANRQLNRALINGLFASELPPLKRNLVKMVFWRKLDFQPQSLATTDGFLIWLKAGLITGLLIALPAIIWFLWTFVAAGLYPHEQKYVYVFLPISLLLFFAGLCLAFFFVFAPVLDFLFSFNRSMGIAPEMRINDWLSFVMFLPLGFGIAFQLPLVMLFVNRIGIISVEAYFQKWRIAVMAISVLSMLLTPADPISMVLMAGPLTFLYFLGIGMCKWMPATSANPFDEEATT